MLYKDIVLIGYSGHGLVVGDTVLALGWPLKYYTEVKAVENNLFGLSYLGNESANDFIGWSRDYDYVLGIGDNKIRTKLGHLVKNNKKPLLNVIHPSADLTHYMQIGMGNFISKQAIVNVNASIGDFCILNTGAIIEHDCRIGNGVHIAPGAVLAGNVTVGDNTFVGANAVIKQGVTIGKNVTIGAGAVVIRNISDNKMVVGNPSREL